MDVLMTDFVHSNIHSIVLIPGSCAFMYDTEIVYGNYGESLNSFDGSISGAKRRIDKLKNEFPNLKKISVVVGWYADSTDAGSLQIAPRIDSKELILNDSWSVGGINRRDAIQSLDKQATPSDISVFHIVSYLSEQGYEVTLYPMLFCDNEEQSWRGYIEAKSNQDIDHFFEQYQKFIKHYASLSIDSIPLKAFLSSYIIGSEMERLLKYDDGTHTYYAVQKMAELATATKQILGKDVETIYAVNWSDYKADKSGYYYLDPLYEAVDVIGIDAYFPLTKGLKQEQITEDVIKQGCGTAYRKLIDWYTKEHINADGSHTSWEPSKKKVIATEIGFPKIDACTEEPYNFGFDGSNFEVLPKSSMGIADPKAQYQAIKAVIEYFEELHAQDAAHKLDHFFQDLYFYCVDIRPDFHKRPDYYSDAHSYEYGHWIAESDDVLVS